MDHLHFELVAQVVSTSVGVIQDFLRTAMSDDLAVNSAVVHGVSPDRELPMVWKIFVGSLINKVYCKQINRAATA